MADIMSSRVRDYSRLQSMIAVAARRVYSRSTLRSLLALWISMSVPAAWAVTQTITTLGISATSVPYQTPITLTATVTAGGSPVTAGLVLFCDATAPVCENNSALGLAQLTSPGATATLKLGSGPLGVHSYKAVFRANKLYASSISNTVSYTVAGTYASTTAISSTGSVGAYTLSGTVAGIGSVFTGPTGNVSFLDTSTGNSVLGTQPLGSAVLSTAFVEAPGSPFAIATSTTLRRSVAIASAYLDSDNNLDVVTGDYAQTITVLLGNGDGTFKPKVNYPGCPTGVAMKILLADLNRDGNTDVALGCSDGAHGSLTILLGNGDGTFNTPVSYTAGDVAGIALGDFNSDGIFDFAVSNHQQQNVMLFTGNGDGTFNAGTIVLSPSSELHDVVVADFNSDHNDDLLYAVNTSASGSQLSDLYLATGKGDGTFNAPALIASKVGEFMATGDTNGDDIPDVVSVTITGTPPNVGNSLFVLIGNGDGTFKPTVTYLSDIPSDPHLADVNGDGKIDIIAGGSYGALVYQGNGDGTFQPYAEPTIGNFALTYAVNAGDYNNDGNADLIGTDADTPRAAVSLSQVQQSATAAALTGVALYPLGSGTHNVDASYAGDTIYQTSVSTTIPLLAAPTPTTLILSVTPTSASLVGQPVKLTATLSPYTVGPPTTTTDGDAVKFYNGATLVGSGSLSGGVATLTTTALPVGLDSITAVFVGDANYNTSTSSSLNVTVTSIVLSSSLNPSTYSQPVTFTATVGPGETGSVTFMDGTTVLGVGAINSGAATYTATTLTVGGHNITGVYSGDGSHSGATSPVLAQQVNKNTPTVNVTTSGPSTYGTPVTITATLPVGSTGTVTVTSGSTTIGTGSVGSDGTYSVTTSSLPVGTDPISASYGGDGNYNPSNGSTNQTVSKDSPTLPAPVLNPSSPAASAPVTITETVPSGVSGPVTFYDGGTAIGTGTVTGGTATLTVPSLPVGTDTITASTPGDTNNNPATSPGTTVTVNKNSPTVTVTTTPSSSAYGSPVTITATLPAGTTGTVTITSGGTTLGSGTVSPTSTVTVTTSVLPAGTDTITASYGGDGNNNPATGSTTQTVTQSTPTVTVTTSGPSTYGSPVTITATVPPGTTGTVTITSGGTTLGSGTVSPTGTVTVTTSTLPVGSDTITASYGGDSNNNPASGSTTQTVSKGSPTLPAPGVNPSSPTAGSPVTITETVPTGVSGPVTFYDGGTAIGTAPVTGGTATLTVPSLPVGTDTITASTPGDSNNNPATSPGTTVTVKKNSPTLPAPVLNPGNPAAGVPVTITETVPTGVSGPVTFYDGGTAIGTGPIVGGVATLTVPSLPLGTDTITASTPGDANNNPATSPGTTVTVNKNSPTLPPPAVNPSNAVLGAPVTITETVPTGVSGPVTFSNGSTVLGSAPVTGGIATLTVTTLPLGTNTITASTPGDANNNPATSPGTPVTVNKTAPTVTVTTSGPSTYGSPVTITASVPAGTTGTVTITSGGTTLGSGTVSPAGTVTITTSSLPVGTDTITANYGGDSNNAAASGSTTQTVSQSTPTVTVTTSGPTTYGSPVTITASVPPGTTGTVTITSGGTTLGSGTVSPTGTVTVTTSTLPVGGDTITASYGGDTNNAPASGSTTQTVSKNSPTVTLTSSSNPSSATQPVTLTATVPTNATGTVTFTDGSTVIGTATVTNGVATITTSTLPVGSDPIIASYSGDTNNNPGVSSQLTQTVNKNSPTLPPPGVSSTSTDATSPVTITETVPTGVSGPVTFYDGGTVIGTGSVVNGVATLTVPSLPVGSDPITASTPGDANNNPATSPATTVTVSKVTPVLPPPVVTPNNPVVGATVTISETVPTGVTGPVTFYNGGTVIGTGTAVNGVATITTSTLPLGTDPITASTQSNASYNAATSPATNVNVAKAAGSVALTSSANPATLGQAVTFTAVVNGVTTGSVTFYDGATAIGAGAINASGIATFTTSTLVSGSHAITASFAGDANYSAATSAVLNEVVNRTPTIIVVTESSPMQLLNSTVTFTANVTAPNPTPTGTVTFFDGTTAIGSAPLSTDGTAVVSLALSGSAAYATSSLTAGAHQITASYSGDTGFMPSASAPVANVVADFTNAATGTTTQKMFPGGTTSYTFLLTPVGADKFLSDTSVTIAGLPEGTTYSFSPAVIKAGSGATTVTLTLTTSKTLKAENHAPPAAGSGGGVTTTLAMLGLLGMGAIRRYRKQMPRLMLLVLVSLASLLPIAAMTGCAGGYFALDPNTYTLNVTGIEGSIQHTATTTLVVQ